MLVKRQTAPEPASHPADAVETASPGLSDWDADFPGLSDQESSAAEGDCAPAADVLSDSLPVGVSQASGAGDSETDHLAR